MIAYRRNQILAVVLGAVALAHVSSAAAVADPSTLRRRNIVAATENNNDKRDDHHEQHSLLDPLRKLLELPSGNQAWWNKIQARKGNRAGGNSPTSFSNDGDCFLGLTVMGLPCDDGVGTDNYVQPTTPEPSAAPTLKPSAAPTSSPTAAPTTSPTASPTEVPTASPTGSPTSGPTAAPTSAPTSGPTAAPTGSPTSGPTAAPTGSPTSGPTAAPTGSPTSGPTAAPTTSAPTSSPTKVHSGQPSAAPTTLAPTSSPTKVHSGSPSAVPTTASPTSSPTEVHSGQPSAAPTTSAPTSSPTKVHSGRPSAAPTTSAPTSSPTEVHSGQPTAPLGGGDDPRDPSSPNEVESYSGDLAIPYNFQIANEGGELTPEDIADIEKALGILSQRLAEGTFTDAGSRRLRLRRALEVSDSSRHLLVEYNENAPAEVKDAEPAECLSSTDPGPCYNIDAETTLTLVDEDRSAVREEFRKAMKDAIANGLLTQILREINPDTTLVATAEPSDGIDGDSIGDDGASGGGGDTITETSTASECVQCTNIPTKYMINTNKTCATYSYAFERRCGTEFGWWGRNNNTEHCQYSCWENGVPFASQDGAPCCERDEADDDVTSSANGAEGGDEATTDSIGETPTTSSTSAPTSTPTVAHSGSPSAAPVSPSPTTSAPTTSSPTLVPSSSPIALDSAASVGGGSPTTSTADGIDGDSIGDDGASGGGGDTITETSTASECVQCTNIPTKYMINTNKTCATYSYAFERRCGTEFGWWGRNNNTEHCQYSCWENGVPFASQDGAPCCERDEADDDVTSSANGAEGGDEATTDSIGENTVGDDDPSETGAETSTPKGETDGGGNAEAETDGGGNTEDTPSSGDGAGEEVSGAENDAAASGSDPAGADASTAGGTDGGDSSGGSDTTDGPSGTDASTTGGMDGGEPSAQGSDGGSDTTNGGTTDDTTDGSTTNEGKDVDLSDDGSGIADPLGDPDDESVSSVEYLPVSLTPFGVEITSEQPVDREVLSRVTEGFLHEYFKDELPKMGYPYYNNVALSADEVNRRQRSLRARFLQALEQEIMISGNVNFEEKPLPDTQLLDNLRSAAFAGPASKAAYLDALRNSGDPGLQSTTNITIYAEGDSAFNPSASERIQPGPNTADDDGDNGFRSYVIAAMAALSFVVFGTALFLYNRKQMRDHRDDKDGLMSEFSEEAPDSVLLKGDLGCSDSVDSQDDVMKKVPSIEPEPISLIRDAKTLERAMVRSSYNRSLIEKANERVERKSVVMPDDDDDSKTISFAEIIAKSHSQSPRTKGQWQNIEPMLSPETNEDEKDISQKELLSPPVSVDPPTDQSFDENDKSSVKKADASVDSDDPCLEGCGNESPSRKLLEESSYAGTSGFSKALVACSPTTQFCGDDDNYSFHEGPATDNSMVAPTSFTPTIELPPAPISMTVDKISPNHQQIVKALAEGNPSTPFSLMTYTVHRGDGQTLPYQVSSEMDNVVLDSAHEIEVVPSPNGRVGIDSHPHVVVEDHRPSNKPLGIAAHPYATVKPTEPLSP